MSRLMSPRRKDGTFEFKYTPAAATDVRETFRRAREEQAKQPPNVRPIKRERKS